MVLDLQQSVSEGCKYDNHAATKFNHFAALSTTAEMMKTSNILIPRRIK